MIQDLSLRVVDELHRAAGEPVDREGLRRRLRVADGEIEGAVEALRGAGYVIESAHVHGSAGYRLLEAPDRLYAHEIERHLTTRWVGRPVESHEVLDSTNSRARELIAEGAGSGALVVAEEQTAGRGRGGRRWHSPPGPGLTFTLILRPGPQPVAFLQITTAVAVAHGVMRVVGRPTQLRWPNDVLLAGRKVAGILVESAESLSAFAVGVGLNVNHAREDLPPEFRAEATSLAEVGGERLSRLSVLATVLGSLEEWYDRMAAGDVQAVAEAWRPLSSLLDREVVVHRGKERLEGRVLDLSPLEGLRLHGDDGNERWIPAEHVTFIRPATNVTGE